MENVLRSVGAQVRTFRKAQGISQEKLAERAGLHFTYVGGVERGERNISLENLNRIAKGLGLEIRDLFPVKHSGPDRLSELLTILKCKDGKTVELMLGIARRIPCPNIR